MKTYNKSMANILAMLNGARTVQEIIFGGVLAHKE
jgi:hypothetical protein